MTVNRQSNNVRRTWWGIVLLWVGCGVFGVYTLATSDRELVRFWDEADLVLDLGAANLADADSQADAAPSYVVRKIGYAYPLRLIREWFGERGYDIYNLILWVILLILPVPGLKPRWLPLLLKACALSALPFMVKYVSMLNPTLQSMVLWLVLATLLTRWAQTHARRGALKVLCTLGIGLVGGVLVLTDFKWLPFAVTAIGLTVVWAWYSQRGAEHRDDSQSKARALQWIIDACLMAIWIPIVMLVVTLIYPPYGRMVYAMLFELPQEVGVMRWGLSSNVLVHLWSLGGLAFVVGAAVLAFSQGRAWVKRNNRFAPYVICAGLIVVVFTIVLWPRGARMYAPAVACLIQFGVIGVSQTFNAQPRQPVRIWSWVGIGLMTLSLLINVPQVRDALDTPTGLDTLQHEILARIGRARTGSPAGTPRIEPPFMTTMAPLLMRARVGSEYNLAWLSPLITISPRVNWAVTNLALDQYTIDEQATSNPQGRQWKLSSYSKVAVIYQRGQTVVSIPAPYFSTPYYLCETTYEGLKLVEMIRSNLPSEWGLTYIGTLHGRSLPAEDSR